MLMMIKLASNSDIARRLSSRLPQRLVQSRVVVRFEKPVPRWMAYEFLRIKMTPWMLARGEPVKTSARYVRRGVVGVELVPEWIVNPAEHASRQYVTAIMLVLDRRYHEDTLAAVYRTAGLLAERLGVRIK